MADQDPIIIADPGPLIRLAAAELLDTMRLTNRRIVLIDRIEEEVCGDPSKPFASEISAWIASMNGALERAETFEAIASLYNLKPVVSTVIEANHLPVE